MAGPRPSDQYNPTSGTEPTTQAPEDYARVQTSPEAFGAGIGQAIEGAGAQLKESQQKAFDFQMQQQGMLNEIAITNADGAAQVQQGQINSTLRSKEGLEAFHAAPQAIADVQKIQEQTMKSMPNLAQQRGYAVVSRRSTDYLVRDINDYAATQLKQAHVQSANDAMNLQVAKLSDPAVAFDEQRSKDAFQETKFFALQQLQAKGQIPLKADGTPNIDANGEPIFSNSDEDQLRKAQYDNFMHAAIGKGWENRMDAMALGNEVEPGNPLLARKILIDHKDEIPPDTYAKISEKLSPIIRTYQAKIIVDDRINQLNADYSGSFNNYSQFSGQKVTPDEAWANLHQQESSSRTHGVPTSVDGAGGPGQITKDTFALFAHPGERWDNDADNIAVSKRAIAKYVQDYNGDMSRVAVAYFSGPGNVAPEDSPTPWLRNTHDGNMKYTSEYVNDVIGRSGQLNPGAKPGASPGQGYQTKADYYNQHYEETIQGARDDYLRLHPGDVQGADLAAQNMRVRMEEVFTAQAREDRGNRDIVMDAITGKYTNGQVLTTPEQLENSPNPDVRHAWLEMNANDGINAANIRSRVLPSMIRADNTHYGQDFYHQVIGVLNGTVKDPSQLGHMIGDGSSNSPLTMSGLGKLREIGDTNSDPQRVAFNKDEAKFIQQLYDNATGAHFSPNGVNPSLIKEFNNQMPVLIQAVEAGVQQGKTSQQLFSPTINGKSNPDYVGNFVSIPTFNKIIEANTAMMAGSPQGVQAPQVDYRAPQTAFDQAIKQNPQDQHSAKLAAGKVLQDMIRSHQISRQQAVQYLKDKGWYSEAPAPKTFTGVR